MWGALIGAAVTGAMTIYSNYQNEKAASEAKKAAAAAAAELKAAYADVIGDVEKHYAQTADEKTRGEQDVADYREALRGANNEDRVRDFYAGVYGYETDENGTVRLDEKGNPIPKSGRFSYDKTIESFMDPRAEYLSELAGTKASQQAGGQGLGGSSFALEAFGNALTDKNEALYRDALAAYNTDRSQSYQEWNGYLQQKQNELSQLLAGASTDLSAKKDLASLYTDEQNRYWEDLLNARIAAAQAGYAADSATANTGNYQIDLGGSAQMIGTGANLGAKVGDYFTGGAGKTPTTASPV